jgi:hypothetical protein
LFVFDGLNVENVSTGNEHARLGRCKDNGLDVGIRLNLVFPELFGFILEGETDGIDGLGTIEPNDRDAIRFQINVLKELVLSFR